MSAILKSLLLCFLATGSNVSAMSNIYKDGTMKVLSRPGSCENEDPNSMTADMIQCAETRKCIPLSQLNDVEGNCDCCDLSEPCPNDPTGCSCCSDHSDQNRIQPPGNSSCGDINWPGNDQSIVSAYKRKQTFQCAITGRCLLGGMPFSSQNDGVCGCCLPDQLTNLNEDGKCVDYRTNSIDPTFCSCCHDHSDEEPVYRDDWSKFFTCYGVKKPIEKFTDDVIDCDLDCIELTVKEKCEKEFSATAQKTQMELNEMWCKKLQSKGTPYFQCTSGEDVHQKCLVLAEVMDGHVQCNDGEDEDSSVHFECSEATKAHFCGEASDNCVLVEGEDTKVSCRCPKGKPKCLVKRPMSCEQMNAAGVQHFECPGEGLKRCIPQNQVGDGIAQCEGGEDENVLV